MAWLKFSQMAISCQDPIATEKFYTKYFGFQRARVAPLGKEQIVFLKLDDMYLELIQAKEESPTYQIRNDGPAYPGWRHLGFQVDNVDAKLAEMGEDAKISLGPLNFDEFISGWRSVWITDPNGNIIEISQGYTDQDNPPSLEANEEVASIC
ncbi:VOC family protein [Scytonema millei]|uniref:VOC family protein n=1 Tax=Scytonema millei VB511283 TaxID=1245923 RepID=A0A9X5I5G6_9CYAN|nr:VOC family protein [Scytonema millei]NHC36000.1 VOC family protein [Scytonema millei VB511283]